MADALFPSREIYVGDKLDFLSDVDNFPPTDGYTLKFRLVPRVSGTAITLTATQDTEDESLYRTTVAPAVTALWTAGEFSVFPWVEKSGDRQTLSKETVTILADPSTVAAYDARSPARKALDAINAVLDTWGTNSHVQEYTIGSRSMRFATKSDALVMRDALKFEVWREEETDRLAAGLPSRRNVYVRSARA